MNPMIRASFFFIIGLVIIGQLSAQESTNSGYLESIAVDLDNHNQVFYTHEIKPQETLYSLSRFFQVRVQDLLLLNNISQADAVAIGTKIKVPIKKEFIDTSVEPQGPNKIPVIYTVVQRETLFKIANSYFPQPIQNLINRNKVNSFSITAGANLVVGWWAPDPSNAAVERPQPIEEGTSDPKPGRKKASPRKSGENNDAEPVTQEEVKKNQKPSIAEMIRNKILRKGTVEKDNSENQAEDQVQKAPKRKESPETTPQSTSDPTEREVFDGYTFPQQSSEEQLDTIISGVSVIDTLEVVEEEPLINYKSGLAKWDKEGFEKENLFVMHNEAKTNSYMRLRHPVTGKEVTALVLCPIPGGLHSDNIDIILSPAVALALGALNSTFKIEMDYYQ